MAGMVALIATYDTKGREAEFIKAAIRARGAECLTINVGVGAPPEGVPDVSLDALCHSAAMTADQLRALPRGEAVSKVSALLEGYLLQIVSEVKITCVAGIGGAGGTQIATQAMRKLPFGIPKLMLSTLASGNMRWYLEASDIMMIPSICDVAGLNRVSKVSFERLAALAAAAAHWYHERGAFYRAGLQDSSRRTVSQTMYGTTTKGVSQAREVLDRHGFETIVFHASGAGGMAMESFIDQGVIHGVLEMTLAEIASYLVGGLHSAGPHRLEAAARRGIPQLIVPGAADTVVLPPLAQVPDKFRNRILNVHNPTMTTLRTNPEENVAIADMICDKILASRGPVKVILPKGGLSSIDKPGAIFYLPEANEALFERFRQRLEGQIEIIEDPRHLDDPGFAAMVGEIFAQMMFDYYGKDKPS